MTTSPGVRPTPTATRAAAAATIAFAFIATFALGGLVIETLLLYPNIFADVPRSLVDALDFMAVTAPSDVLPPLGATTVVAAVTAVGLTLRLRAARPWTLGAATSLLFGEFLFSAVWFWPRNEIMFIEGPAVHDASYLQQVAAEFQAGHWVRVAMAVGTAVLAFTAMLRVQRRAGS